jgi:hypothetical protein
MRWIGIRSGSAGCALGIVLVCNLPLFAGGAAPAAAAPVAGCTNLRGGPRAICSAYVKAGCLGASRQACTALRRVYTKLTASQFFPFEFTPTPSHTPTPTATPTPTPVPELSAPAGLRQGSMVVFPKIMANGRDTVVQLTNTSNNPVVDVHCFYSQLVVQGDPPTWEEIAFRIALRRQQPTHWAASTGRPVDPSDPLGSDGAGTDPGEIPAVPMGFVGELRCFETSPDDSPVGRNALTGTATVFDANGDFSAYDAITLRGLAVDQDRTLRLDGVEYEACPGTLRVSHLRDWSIITGSQVIPVVTNRLTLVPCALNYAMQRPTQARARISVTDEFGQTVEQTVDVVGWTEVVLGQVLPAGLAGAWWQTVVRPAGQSCVGGSQSGEPCTSSGQCPEGSCVTVGLLGVLETTRLIGELGGQSMPIDYGRVALNLNTEGAQPGATVVLPPQGVMP